MKCACHLQTSTATWLGAVKCLRGLKLLHDMLWSNVDLRQAFRERFDSFPFTYLLYSCNCSRPYYSYAHCVASANFIFCRKTAHLPLVLERDLVSSQPYTMEEHDSLGSFVGSDPASGKDDLNVALVAQAPSREESPPSCVPFLPHRTKGSLDECRPLEIACRQSEDSTDLRLFEPNDHSFDHSMFRRQKIENAILTEVGEWLDSDGAYLALRKHKLRSVRFGTPTDLLSSIVQALSL